VNVDPGFFMSPETLEILSQKTRRLSAGSIIGQGHMATIGSTITLIDCLDSHIHMFRLVHSVRRPGTRHNDLPVDSTLGLALLGSSIGDCVNFSLGGEEGKMVVLRIDNKN
jgi:transcription elongation GreA/GreB family factor